MTVQSPAVREEALAILSRLGVTDDAFAGDGMAAASPITGETMATVRTASPKEVGAAIGRAAAAFEAWRVVPPPRRGEFVRLLGEELRAAKADLGRLVTLEAGKIVSEGLGEVQEMIDICDFAVGLSRQLYGLTIATERADHRMMETWHPLGVCGSDLGVQFSGRGVVVERRARPGVRRSRGVEALGEDAADGARDASRGRPRDAPVRRCAAGTLRAADRRPRRR